VICTLEKGRIAGGEVVAFGEIRAKELGADGGAGTIFRSGFRFKTFKKLAEMENLREKIDSEIAKIKKSIMSPRVGQEEILNLKKFLDKLYQASRKINDNIGAMYDRLKVNPLASVKGEGAISAGCVVYIGFVERKIVKAMRKANLYADGEGGMNVAYYDPMSDTMKSFNVRPKK
ncbi:MAG: FapA family protein, partial [bacterium]